MTNENRPKQWRSGCNKSYLLSVSRRIKQKAGLPPHRWHNIFICQRTLTCAKWTRRLIKRFYQIFFASFSHVLQRNSKPAHCLFKICSRWEDLSLQADRNDNSTDRTTSALWTRFCLLMFVFQPHKDLHSLLFHERAGFHVDVRDSVIALHFYYSIFLPNAY